MRAIGIICEYNPFHAGHAYLLRAAREEGTAVCLMSGDFTQRGEAAILPPTVRGEMALCGGAQLVLELPFPYAAASAEHFARCGVRTLAALGVQQLMFGSEYADTERLTRAARRLASPELASFLATEGKRRGAVRALFEYLGEEFSSNDLLAIHYIKAILAEGLPLQPVAVRRVGEGYRSHALEGEYPSATALRERLAATGRAEELAPLLPPCVRETFLTGVERFGIANTEGLGTACLALLRRAATEPQQGTQIAECDGGLLSRLIRSAAQARDHRELCALAASKSYTDGRLRRALLMLLAGVRQGELEAPPAYLRLLAADTAGMQLLAKTRKTRTVPVLTKHAGAARLGEAARRQWELSRVADGLYALCMEKPLTPAALQTLPPCLRTAKAPDGV